jgi:hypothetical protein
MLVRIMPIMVCSGGDDKADDHKDDANANIDDEDDVDNINMCASGAVAPADDAGSNYCCQGEGRERGTRQTITV